MAASQRIERGAARRGATSLNFAAKTIAPRAKKVRPTQLENRDHTIGMKFVFIPIVQLYDPDSRVGGVEKIPLDPA